MSGPAESPGSSPPAGYVAARALVRFLLGLFYRRIDVVGADRVPERGGLVVAANHHNSVVDAMLLIAVLPRHLRTLANAPLFSNPLVGPFLRLLGALPVHRRQEAGNDPARNAALFSATTATLRGGGAIAIFPEGRTQPEPVLMELRTGAARMLLAATTEEAPASPGGVGGGAPPTSTAAPVPAAARGVRRPSASAWFATTSRACGSAKRIGPQTGIPQVRPASRSLTSRAVANAAAASEAGMDWAADAPVQPRRNAAIRDLVIARRGSGGRRAPAAARRRSRASSRSRSRSRR